VKNSYQKPSFSQKPGFYGCKMIDKEKVQLDQLVDAVLKSSRYKSACEDFIRNIGQKELAKQRNLKEAIKATKNKLHQVSGTYLDSGANYAVWLDELREASQKWEVESGKWEVKRSGKEEVGSGWTNRDNLLKVCERIMNYHSSTRERLQILDQFYHTTLTKLAPIRSVIDVACGFNPLSIPWMPLAEDVEYYAYDIYHDMMKFIDEFMTIIHVKGHTQVCDMTQFCPTDKVEMALILKAMPCLEQVDKSAGFRLLDMINADHILVSFPVHSLGGRDKRMVINYEARFRKLVANKNWSIKRFEFATELAFLVTK